MSQSTLPFPDAGQPLAIYIQQQLLPLCEALPETAVPTLTTKIDDYLLAIQEAQQQNEFMDIRLAREIAYRLHKVLQDYGRYPTDQQALIVGAARYFIKNDDAEHDLYSVLGLDDDAVVLNFLLDVLNHPELKIDL